MLVGLLSISLFVAVELDDEGYRPNDLNPVFDVGLNNCMMAGLDAAWTLGRISQDVI